MLLWTFVHMCKLYWAKGCPDSWLNIFFLGVSVRVSLEEISICINRCPHQCGWPPSNPLRPWIEQKGGDWANSLSARAETSIFPCLWTWSSWLLGLWLQQGLTLLVQVLRPSASDWISSPVFLVLQLADGLSRDFSASIKKKKIGFKLLSNQHK